MLVMHWAPVWCCRLRQWALDPACRGGRQAGCGAIDTAGTAGPKCCGRALPPQAGRLAARGQRDLRRGGQHGVPLVTLAGPACTGRGTAPVPRFQGEVTLGRGARSVMTSLSTGRGHRSEPLPGSLLAGPAVALEEPSSLLPGRLRCGWWHWREAPRQHQGTMARRRQVYHHHHS